MASSPPSRASSTPSGPPSKSSTGSAARRGDISRGSAHPLPDRRKRWRRHCGPGRRLRRRSERRSTAADSGTSRRDCVSRGVRDAVSGKVGIEFENRGELEVKNIPEPVGAYGVVFDPVAWTMERPTPKPPNLTTGKWPVAAAAALILLLFGGLVWFILGLYDATAPLRQQQALRTQLGNLAPGAPEPSIEGVARGYELGSGHKALAASRTPPGFWLVGGRASEGAAIEAVLDSCQVAYGSPCYLVAVNATLQPMPASPRDMPRPHYAGSFDPEQIPASNAATKGNRDVMQYATASAPKAIAYTPSGGRVFVTIGGDNQRAVEERALVACTADPVRTNSDSPCFLYAVGDMVVLPMPTAGAVNEIVSLKALSSQMCRAGRPDANLALASSCRAAADFIL